MYIKLYEQWLNEAENITNLNDFTKIIIKKVESNNMNVDKRLNELSQYGIFANDIRMAIKENKAKYSDPIWSTIGTASGVESAIRTFKMMFEKLIGKKEVSDYRSKFEQMMNTAIGSAVDRFEFTDKVLNSKNAVDLMNIITKGNKNFADEIGYYFAMFDIACAITNGLYYVSSEFPLQTKGSEINNPYKTVREAIDGQKFKYTNYSEILSRGEWNFQKSYDKSIPNYVTVGGSGLGRTLVYSVKGSSYALSTDEFKKYIDTLNLNTLKASAEQNYENFDTMSPDYESANGSWLSKKSLPKDFFGVLFIGDYFNNAGLSIIKRSFSFMYEGGATWYQKMIG